MELSLQGATGVPYYRQVIDQISDRVRSGQIAPGSRLPSVRVLATQLAVSLITIRRAYADLEAAGLIIRRQGQGTFVAEEVGPLARARARQDAISGLNQAVDRALDLGLPPPEIRAAVDDHLTSSDRSDR